jgi:hypothetical protein
VDENDLLEIKFIVHAPLIPIHLVISKIVATVHKPIASLGQQQNTQELHLTLNLVFKTQAMLGG